MTTPVRSFEPIDVSVLGAADRLWLTVRSSLGSVHGVWRPWPKWPGAVAAARTPSAWLGEAVGRANRDGWSQAVEVGRLLTDLAFGASEVNALFARTRGVAASRNAQLLVRLLAAPGAVAAWPWELLIDPQQPDQFLATARDAHVVRSPRIRTFALRRETIEPPLNLLLVLSSPLRSGPQDAETPFDLYQEKRALLGDLQPLVDNGLLRIVVEDRPTLDRVRRRMAAERRGFHLLHYLGHANSAGLYLEAGSGRGRAIESVAFARVLQQLPDLRLAVFAGCETACAPEEPAGSEWPGPLSTADHVARDASPVVVGMQAVLPFGTERILTRFFYQALAAGHPVAEALRLARLAVADDDHAGKPLVNWAVPCLVVGSDEPGALIDPGARATPPARVRRVGLRLGVRQSELRFISRLTELRETIDALSGRTPVRLVLLMSRPGTGKTALVDRAIEELDGEVAYLFLSARRLLAAEDPVAELASLASELLTQRGRDPRERGDLDADAWWERLLEDLAQTRLAIVIDDGEELLATAPVPARVCNAIAKLTQRRTETRIAIAGNGDLSTLAADLAPEEVRIIRLEPLAWSDVWQWIRRNLPVLTRYDEHALAGFYAQLPRLEQWEQLAAEVTDGAPQASALAGIVARLAAGGAATAPPPPVFGPQPAAAPRAAAAPEPTQAERTLRVAIAGPFTDGRTREFARAVTQFAAQHQIGGRVIDVGAGDPASAIAHLLEIKSLFAKSGTVSMGDVLRWVDRAAGAGADVILADYGSDRHSKAEEKLLRRLRDEGRLVIAAGGNEGEPSWPAWYADVLAIGALDAEGRAAPYSKPFPKAGKPELYAPETLAGTALAEMVQDPNLRGTSLAALYATAAAIAVWASDRALTADEVRALLVSTATEIAPGVRRIDAAKALDEARSGVLTRALSKRRLGLRELLAATGLRPEVALPLIERLVESRKIHRSATGPGGEVYTLVTRPENEPARPEPAVGASAPAVPRPRAAPPKRRGRAPGGRRTHR